MLGLGVLYVFAVLPIAIVWGLAYAVAVSVASMLAFNFFFLAPATHLHAHRLAQLVRAAVFVVTAVVVSELAARSRRRAREAALLAEIATSLLERGTVSAELERISAEAARALQVERARIELGDDAEPTRTRLTRAGRRVGTILLERAPSRRRRALAAGCCRRSPRCSASRSTGSGSRARRSRPRRCAGPTCQDRALRAVSHDLRTPLMAISTSAGALARPDLTLDDADRAELLATILDASDRLDRLVGEPARPVAAPGRRGRSPSRSCSSVDELVVAALDELGRTAIASR